MAVEIREVVLTARVIGEPRGEEQPPAVVSRELLEACLAEVRRFIERRERR
jgi:hypothetical protein